MSDNKAGTTHFGYQQVPTGDKAKKVGEVFSSVAGNYDLMNDLMSMGCLLYTSPSPRDRQKSRMPSYA